MSKKLTDEEKELKRQNRERLQRQDWGVARRRFEKANELLREIHADPSIRWDKDTFDELVLPHLPLDGAHVFECGHTRFEHAILGVTSNLKCSTPSTYEKEL